MCIVTPLGSNEKVLAIWLTNHVGAPKHVLAPAQTLVHAAWFAVQNLNAHMNQKSNCLIWLLT